ncbi:MAG: T9SS type A sorting domain-containing protein [Ignavibacteria bacterium]|nr:T9SS type A sorting domain-containing protein [Ignavibacteria bacterium]
MSNLYFPKFVFVLVLTIFFSANSFSQNKKHYNLFLTNDNSPLINNTELKNAVSDAVLLNINKEELLSLSENRNQEITLDIPYTQNTVGRLNLKRFDILKSDAKIVARTARGNEEVKLKDIAVSYTGKVDGFDNSFVTITFSNDNVTGLMVTPKQTYILGAVNDKNGKRTDTYVLYKESDMKIKNTFLCDADDNLSSEQIEKMKRSFDKQLTDASATDLYVAEIAIEMDFATYNVYGSSVTNATNYALTLMAASSAIYMKEINVRFVIPYLRVWTTPDPYTGTSSSALLTQFRNEWNANQQSVQRTLAHFITRRGGGLGGIAYIDVLCSGNFGYGLSGTDGPILPLPTYSWDVMVVSHEIGHNFGSPHTMNCNWPGGPIDSCYAVEGGCYTGPVIPTLGTIMSYCHLTSGGISLVKGFGPMPKALIRGNAENNACMTISNRPLFLGYPNGGETYQTGSNKQIYWGTSLTGNVNLEYSINNGSSWITIQNNIPAQQREYIWAIPIIPSVMEAKLRIMDSSNPSIGDTTDASFRIALAISAFSIVSPPSNTRLVVSSTSTGTQQFVWQSGGTEPSIRYKFKIKKFSNPTEYTIDSDNNGADTTATIRLSQLDSIAVLMGTTGDSVRCTWRAYAYNGIDSVGASNSFLINIVRNTVGITSFNSLVPEKFVLGNNYPNPFNPTTNIKFDIAKSTFAELKVFDSRGREVNTLVNEKLQAGTYEYNFNASNLPSGAYFYRLKTDEFTETKRMILVK